MLFRSVYDFGLDEAAIDQRIIASSGPDEYALTNGLTTASLPIVFDNLIAAGGTPCFPNGGSIDTVAVGAFLMVKPLAVGHHTIRVTGAAGPLANPFFVKDATYEITVTP